MVPMTDLLLLASEQAPLQQDRLAIVVRSHGRDVSSDTIYVAYQEDSLQLAIGPRYYRNA